MEVTSVKPESLVTKSQDTDFFLVKADKLHDAVTALQEDGYTIVGQ